MEQKQLDLRMVTADSHQSEGLAPPDLAAWLSQVQGYTEQEV